MRVEVPPLAEPRLTRGVCVSAEEAAFICLRPFMLMLVNDLAEACFDAMHRRANRGCVGAS